MNISLKPFQKDRVGELRRTAAMAQMNWRTEANHLVYSSYRCRKDHHDGKLHRIDAVWR